MSKRILIVEDEVEIAEAFAEVLEGAGYETIQASNGREALAHLHNGEPPDLILLDLAMPVLDGLGFRREQQALEGAAAIPLVVVTADGEARRKAASMKANGHIIKPCTIAALLSEVERHCGPANGSAQLSAAFRP